MKTSRLIIASNRGPVEFYLDHDKRLKKRRAPGDLITGLRNTHKFNRMNVIGIALAMTEGDRLTSKQMWEYNNRRVRSQFCSANSDDVCMFNSSSCSFVILFMSLFDFFFAYI